MTTRTTKAKRRAVALKGWATRRAKAKGRYIWEEHPAARETAEALVSKIGRRAMASVDQITVSPEAFKQMMIVREPGYERAYDDLMHVPDITRGLAPDPNPWVPIAAWVRRLWLRATGWLR